MEQRAGSKHSLTLTVEQLERALNLARRSHDGAVTLRTSHGNSLEWVRIDVFLTDMGNDVGPLHTFYMTPRGVLRPS